ncbi:MAG TPA: hypothetical protein VHU41_08435, partial [Thermoanaerobaculia bacterium]|nr:hypothetical protein [Thermoanaerobaculia bacterium]
FCGDLFTQGGHERPPVTSEDILEWSESFRAAESAVFGFPPHWSHGRDTKATLEKIAATNPLTLACMHGSAWRGEDGAAARLLMALREKVA